MIHFLTLKVVVIYLVFAFGALYWWQHSRARKVVHRWAKAGAMEIVSAERRYLRAGPFTFNYSREQVVFRVIVKDQEGVQRAGWICVGGGLRGVWSDKTKVIWDT